MGGCCGRPKNLSIHFKNLFGVYAPGDEVTGVVYLDLKRPMKACSMSISFYGQAQTYFSGSVERQQYVQDKENGGGEIKTVNVFVCYNASDSYVRNKNMLWLPPYGQETGLIPAGNHRFPFRFQLPRDCQSSFRGDHGDISYPITVVIGKPWYKRDDILVRYLEVVRPSDLNLSQVPRTLLPIQATKRKEIGGKFSKKGNIAMMAKLHQNRFVPGDTCSIEVAIANTSSKKIGNISIQIVQCAIYYGVGEIEADEAKQERGARLRDTTYSGKYFYLLKEKYEDGIAENSRFTIRVPSLIPTHKDEFMISIYYNLIVTMHADGIFKTRLSCSIPIVIGTIPLK